MRISAAIIATAALIVVGWKGTDMHRARQRSPFDLWQLRAGMSFDEVDAFMVREEKRRFTCHEIVASSRLCTVRVTGIHATLRALVDDRNRIAVLAFHPDSGSVVLREESRKVAAQWGLVRRGVSGELEDRGADASITRWRSDDGRWSASMRYDSGSPSPAFVRVADEHAVERVAASGPLARLVLEANAIVEANEIEVAAAMMRVGQVAPVDTGHLTPHPVRAADAPPVCGPEAPEIPIPSTEHRAAMGSAEATLLESAIATAYPGWELIIGRGVWMKDPEGRAERITLAGQASTSSREVIAFPVGFRARNSVATDQGSLLDPREQCRAPSDIVVARRSSDGGFRDARRVAYDEEALASEVVALDVEAPDPERSALVELRYIAGYASDLWFGWVSWQAALPVGFAAPDAPGVRLPLTYGFELGTGDHDVTGALIVDGKRDGGIALTTLEHHAWGYASRTVTIPLDSTGAIRGTVLLGKLF